jgi:hypothetical protein
MEEIIVQLIPGFLGVLTGIAAWLKGHAEVNQVKKEREVTKKDRDESIQKLSWELEHIKAEQVHQGSLNDEFRQQFTILNKSITEIKTLVELLVDNRIKNRGC